MRFCKTLVASCQFQCEHRDNTADTNLMHFFFTIRPVSDMYWWWNRFTSAKSLILFRISAKTYGFFVASSFALFFFFFIENITFQFSLTIFCIFTYFEIKSNGKLFSQLIWNNINTLFLQLFDMPVSIQIIPMYNHVINF